MSTAWLPDVVPQWIGGKHRSRRRCSRDAEPAEAVADTPRAAGAGHVAGAAVLRDDVADHQRAVAVRVQLDAEALVVVEPVAGDQGRRRRAVEPVRPCCPTTRCRRSGTLEYSRRDARSAAGAPSIRTHWTESALRPPRWVMSRCAEHDVVAAHVDGLVAVVAAAGLGSSSRRSCSPRPWRRGSEHGDVAVEDDRLLGAVGLAARRERGPGLEPVQLPDALRALAQAQHPPVAWVPAGFEATKAASVSLAPWMSSHWGWVVKVS